MIKKKTVAQKSGAAKKASAGKQIDAITDTITEGSADWRDEMLARLRALIKQAAPEAVEEPKWKKPSNPAGVPVWSQNGILFTGEKYKAAVKMTFAYGAALEDPAGLFNSSLEGNVRRAIDFHEGDKVDEKALKALIRSAVALNMSKG